MTVIGSDLAHGLLGHLRCFLSIKERPEHRLHSQRGRKDVPQAPSGIADILEGVHGLARNEGDIAGAHVMQSTVHLYIEGAFEKEEGLILTVVDVPWSADTGLDDVFENRDRSLGLIA